MVEDEADERVRAVIDSRGRRDVSDAGEDQWCVDISPERGRVTASEEPEWDRRESPDQEEIKQRVIEGTFGEHLPRPHDSPYDRCIVDRPAVRTCEAVRLSSLADSINVSERPSLDQHLNETSDDGPNDL